MLNESIILQPLCINFHFLLNGSIDCHVRLAYLDMNWSFMAKILSELSNLLRPSSCEQHSLTIRSNLANDFSNLRLKTHVKHSISFI